VHLGARDARRLILDKSPKVKLVVDPPIRGTTRKINHPMLVTREEKESTTVAMGVAKVATSLQSAPRR
jgi:hypothetical protein